MGFDIEYRHAPTGALNHSWRVFPPIPPPMRMRSAYLDADEAKRIFVLLLLVGYRMTWRMKYNPTTLQSSRESADKLHVEASKTMYRLCITLVAG